MKKVILKDKPLSIILICLVIISLGKCHTSGDKRGGRLKGELHHKIAKSPEGYYYEYLALIAKEEQEKDVSLKYMIFWKSLNGDLYKKIIKINTNEFCFMLKNGKKVELREPSFGVYTLNNDYSFSLIMEKQKDIKRLYKKLQKGGFPDMKYPLLEEGIEKRLHLFRQ